MMCQCGSAVRQPMWTCVCHVTTRGPMRCGQVAGGRLLVCLVLVYCLSVTDCQYHGLKCTEFSSPKKLIIKKDMDPLEISLPTVAEKYSRNQKCEWLIQAFQPNDVVILTVKQSTIQGIDVRGECNSDYVDVLNVKDFTTDPVTEGHLLGRFCGRAQFESQYVSSGREMLVRFISDSAFEYSGFEADVTSAAKPPVEQSWSSHVVNMAVGVPTGLFIFFLLSVFAIVVIRRRRNNQIRRQQEASAGSMAAVRSAETGAGGGLDFMAAGSGLPPYSSSPEDGTSRRLSSRSVPTSRDYDPPPAYDAVEFDPRFSESADLPSEPPSYDDAVKESQQS